MAVMLRTVSASFGRLTRSSGAAARVLCGMGSIRLPTYSFNDQDSFGFAKSKRVPAGGFSQSTVDVPARCQAAVAVRPLPTKQVDILERPATIDQPAAPLPRSFLAESVNGTVVECTGRGSRPLYTDVLAAFGGLELPGASSSSPLDCSELFRAALASNPGDARLISEFAMFTWKSVGDVDAAEVLFHRALEIAPDDPAIHANHALFLWQCED